MGTAYMGSFRNKMAEFLVKVLLVICTILVRNSVTAYYCDSDKCNFDEYCCGINRCCTSYNVWQMWYFWCGLVLFLILLFACAGFWRYKYYSQTPVIQGTSVYSKFDTTGTSHHIRTDSDVSVQSLDEFTSQYSDYNTQLVLAPGYTPRDYGFNGPPVYSKAAGHSDRNVLLKTDY